MCCAFLFVACDDEKEPEAPAHTHSYTEEIIEDATCTTPGTKKLTCSCGDTKTETIPAKGHEWGAQTEVVDATCGQAGSYKHTCTREGCGFSETVTVPATGGHTYGEWITDTDATCTTAGSKHRVCSGCQNEEIASIDPLGHSWGEWETIEAPTCGQAGSHKHKCQRPGCNVEETEVDPATGNHIYEDGICTGCGKEEPKACDHVWVPATCTTPKTCSKCGETEGGAKGHTYADTWSTDNNSHWKNYTCGCTGKGYEQKHTFDYNDDGDEVCTICGYNCTTENHEHQFSDEWSYDSDEHWHSAICGHDDEVTNVGEHVDDDGDDVCDVCGARLVDAYDPTAKYNTYNWDKTTIYVCLNENSNNQELSSQLRRYLAGDTDQSDYVDTLVAQRNAGAYSTTNVNVIYTYWGENDTNTDSSSWGQSITKMVETVMANAPASPDIYCNQIYDMVSASLQKCFANIRTTKLSGGDNNFSFTEQEFVDYADAYGEEYGYMMEYMTELGFSVKKQYLIASDYFIDLVRAFFVVPLNISLLGEIDGTEVGLGDDDGYFTVDDFYTMVMAKEWTYDTLIKYADAIYDPTSGVAGGSINDRNGIILTSSNGMVASALLYTTSVKIFTRQLDETTGFYKCSYPDTNDDLVNYCAKLAELAGSVGVHVEAVDHMAVREQFTSDNVLFGGIILLGSLEYGEYQDMKSSSRGGFGILPVPVYREGDSYLTLIHNMGRIAGIAANTTEFAQCSAFIDYQSTHSSDILNEYYESKLQYEMAGGSKGNITILNYIRENVRSAFDKTYEDAIGYYFKGLDSQASATSWAGILQTNGYKVTTMRDLYLSNKNTRATYLEDIIKAYDQLPE